MVEIVNHKPLFSVLMANYNNGRFLGDAINSIVNQSYKNWEIIFVDDASTDNSVEIIEGFISNGLNIKLYKHEIKLEVGATKDDCCRFGNGFIFGFLDSDDTLSPDALKIMIKAHLSNPRHSIIYSSLYYCDSSLKIKFQARWIKQIPPDLTNLHVDYVSQFATFKGDFYRKSGGADRSLTSAIDKDLWYRIEEYGPVLFVDKSLYFYRENINGVSQNKNLNLARENHLKVIRQAMKRREKSGFPNLSCFEYQTIRSNYLLRTIQERYKIENSFLRMTFSIFFSFIRFPFKHNALRAKMIYHALVKER